MDIYELLYQYEQIKKVLKMNDNDSFDIDLAPLNARIEDNDLFDERERPSVDCLNNFISCTHELKNQPTTLSTSNYFVEYKMLVKGKEHYSGIHTTKAVLQTYTIKGITHSYPTEFIYWIYQNKDRLDLKDGKKNDTDYIATGVLVPIYRIFELYRQYESETAIKRLRNKSTQ